MWSIVLMTSATDIMYVSYTEVTWALLRLKPPVTLLCIKHSIQCNNNEIWMANRIDDRWVPVTQNARNVEDISLSLQWRHNDGDGVWNHGRIDGLHNRLLTRTPKKTSKLLVIGFVRRFHQSTRKVLPFDDVTMVRMLSCVICYPNWKATNCVSSFWGVPYIRCND